jgi:hypothetical protein
MVYIRSVSVVVVKTKKKKKNSSPVLSIPHIQKQPTARKMMETKIREETVNHHISWAICKSLPIYFLALFGSKGIKRS